MSADFITALDAQIDAEESELSAIPAFGRWMELKKVRALYRVAKGPVTVVSPPFHRADSGTRAESGRTLGQGKRRSRHSETVETVKSWMSEGQSIPTQEIMDRLEHQGTLIEGKNPRNSMHSILYHAGIFESMGRAGWRLKDAHNEKAADALFPEQEASAASSEPRLTSEGNYVERQQPPGGGG